MKNKIIHIEIDDKKIPLIFNLNVMEEIQEQYGSLEKWGEVTQGDGEPMIKDLKAGVMAMINEAIDIENEENGLNATPLNEKQVGRLLSQIGLAEITKKIQEITIASTDSGEDNGKNE